jgi:hypothetical protein
MRNIILILFLSLISTVIFAQNTAKKPSTQAKIDTIRWETLTKITYKKEIDDEYGIIKKPVFPDNLKAYNGKKVYISGYIIPTEPGVYILSKNVFASCFFCGASGIETVMGIEFKELNQRLRTDQYVTLEGTLFLNDYDINTWIYNIIDTRIVKIGR